MITYIATFYSHYGAIQFRRNCEAMNLKAEVMPVPRDLSSSCGTCVRFQTEDTFPEKTEEVEWSSRGMWGFIMRMKNN